MSDWTDLEEGFFAAAPPEVPLPPPAPASFDDLVPIQPERRSSRRSRARAVVRAKTKTKTMPAFVMVAIVKLAIVKLAYVKLALGRATSFFRRFVQKGWSVALPASVRAWRWTLSRARTGVRALGPALAMTRTRGKQALRVLAARVARDLPEVPDGKTMLAAMAALIIVLGLSASVLGSRLAHPLAPPRAVPAPTIGAPVAP